MAKKPIDLNDFRRKKRFSALAMCLTCFKRWISIIDVTQSLYCLKCPNCGEDESFASILPDEYLEEARKNLSES